MDWITLASTAVGAVAVLMGTVLANVLGNRGQRDRDNRADRRESYLHFLLALNGAHAELRLVAARAEVEDIEYQTQRALNMHKVYEGREQMLMSASRWVLGSAENAFNGLIRLRQAIIAGARLHTIEYHAAYHEYANALWDLRRALRRDLGSGGLHPSDLDRDSWDGRETCTFCRGHDSASVPTQSR